MSLTALEPTDQSGHFRPYQSGPANVIGQGTVMRFSAVLTVPELSATFAFGRVARFFAFGRRVGDVARGWFGRCRRILGYLGELILDRGSLTGDPQIDR